MDNIRYSSLSCQICMFLYDDEENSPIIISCGHTFCKTCIKKMFYQQTSSQTENHEGLISKSQSCPVCKKNILINQDVILTPNYELLSLIIKTDKKIENSCEKHPHEKLLFFCSSCKYLICQVCLLLNHIGKDHEIQRPEDSEISKSMKVFNNYNNLVKESRELKLKKGLSTKKIYSLIDSKIHEINNKVNLIGNMLKLQYFLNESQIDSVIDSLDNIKEEMTEEYNMIIKKSKKQNIDKILLEKYISSKDKFECLNNKIFDNSSLFLNEIGCKINETIVNYIENNKGIHSFMSNYLTNDCKNLVLNQELGHIKNFGDFFIDGKISNFRYEYSNINKEHLRLIDIVALRIECESEFILSIMKSIDRADFVPSISIHTYSDNPLMIGWNTTISAPYMHMLTISYLSKILDNEKLSTISTGKHSNELSKSIFPSLKGLDIGCGSGYMTLALSKLLGPNSVVYGIDHIQEIINYSKSNISKNHKEYIENNRIQFLLMDAQTCIPDEKFDIIHVGAAVEHFPQIFFDKMKDGGYMWIPVGPKNAFKNIFLCNKKGEEMIKSELMTRSYAEMTTKEEQLSHYDEVIDENNSIDDELERFLDV